MRICRFDGDRIGVVEHESVYDVTPIAHALMASRPAGELGDPLVAVVPQLCATPAATLLAGPVKRVEGVALGSPVRSPSKILAAPDNYRAHLEEMRASGASVGRQPSTLEKDGLFLKASSSIAGPADGVAVRFLERRTDYEAELVVVVGTRCSDVTPAAARDHIAGYALGLDITLRGTEERSLRKSIDGYSVVGPWLVTASDVDPAAIDLTLALNGEVRQQTSTSDLLTGVDGLVAYASQFYTLHPGDLLFTGTPAGVGPIRPGDRLTVSGSGIGTMQVLVRAHQPAYESVTR